MKKLVALAAAAAGLLALSAPAQAKEILSLKVCGASGCVKSTDPKVLAGWEGGNQDPAQVWQTNPGGYYKVTVGYGDQGKLVAAEPAYWLPGRNLMRFTGQSGYPWWKLFPAQVKMLRAVAGDLSPFTPTLARVTVRGKSVADPNSYLRLLGRLHEAYLPYRAPHRHRLRIALHTPSANPWIHSSLGLRYVPKKRILIRPDGEFRVPKAMARRVMRRVSLAGGAAAAQPDRPRRDSASLYAGIGAAGLAGALALAALCVRKARDS
jgi:hypothetical protein